MCPDRRYYVYILASRSQVLYTGVTNDLHRRVYQHKAGVLPGFTKRYSVTRLVYFETTPDVLAAIAREKVIKSWTRERRIRLVESVNAPWLDLAADWFPAMGGQDPSLRSG
jgi:putative endonuclease